MKIQFFRIPVILLTVILILSFKLSIAQVVPYWRLNGNPLFGIDGVNTANNFFGTSLGNPTSIRFGTNGANQMILQNGTGFLGVCSTVGFSPSNLVHVHDGANSFIQVTNGSTGFASTNGVKLGLLGNT